MLFRSYLEQNKTDDALAVLDAMIKSSTTVSQMKKLAMLKLVSYKLDTNAPADEINELLTSVSDAENSDIVKEMTAMLYIRENDLEKAKAEYQKIVSSTNAPEALKYRAMDMINLLSDK